MGTQSERKECKMMNLELRNLVFAMEGWSTFRSHIGIKRREVVAHLPV